MIRYAIHLSPSGEEAIEEQIAWLKLSPSGDGSRLARRWYDDLGAVFESLTRHPERNGFAPENGSAVPGTEVRQKRFRPWKGKPGWRVIYAIDTPGGIINILDVRSERQPWAEG